MFIFASLALTYEGTGKGLGKIYWTTKLRWLYSQCAQFESASSKLSLVVKCLEDSRDFVGVIRCFDMLRGWIQMWKVALKKTQSTYRYHYSNIRTWKLDLDCQALCFFCCCWWSNPFSSTWGGGLCNDDQWPFNQYYIHNALIGFYDPWGGAASLLHQHKCESFRSAMMEQEVRRRSGLFVGLFVHIHPRKETWSLFPVLFSPHPERWRCISCTSGEIRLCFLIRV